MSLLIEFALTVVLLAVSAQQEDVQGVAWETQAAHSVAPSPQVQGEPSAPSPDEASSNGRTPAFGAEDVGSTPAASATPSPVVPTGSISDLICAQSWSCRQALAVAWCESRYQPSALSAGGHRGVFQLARVHAWRFERRGWTWQDAYNAERNIEIAFELWAETRDWRHWACAPG